MPKYGLITSVFPLESNISRERRDSSIFTGTADLLPGYARQTPVILTVPNRGAPEHLLVRALISDLLQKRLNLPALDTHPVACSASKLPRNSACVAGRDLTEHLKALAAIDINPHVPKYPHSLDDLLNNARIDIWRHLPAIAVHDEILAIAGRLEITVWRIGKKEYLFLGHDPVVSPTKYSVFRSVEDCLSSFTAGGNNVATLIGQSGFLISINQMLKLAASCARSIDFTTEEFSKNLDIYTLLGRSRIQNVLEILNRRLATTEDSLRNYVEKSQLFGQ